MRVYFSFDIKKEYINLYKGNERVLYNILKTSLQSKYKGKVSAGEIGLPITDNNLILPCGIYGRWENEDTI